MSGQKTRQWKCPVCGKDCRSFCVDSQQIWAIAQYKKKYQKLGEKIAKQVVFYRDGHIDFGVEDSMDEESPRKSNSAKK